MQRCCQGCDLQECSINHDQPVDRPRAQAWGRERKTAWHQALRRGSTAQHSPNLDDWKPFGHVCNVLGCHQNKQLTKVVLPHWAEQQRQREVVKHWMLEVGGGLMIASCPELDSWQYAWLLHLQEGSFSDGVRTQNIAGKRRLCALNERVLPLRLLAHMSGFDSLFHGNP